MDESSNFINSAGDWAVSVAAQTGRLDLLTATLTVLAIILGLGVFPLIYFLRRRAAVVAREETKKVTDTIPALVEALAISKMEQLLPTLVEEYSELARNAVTSDIANAIAEAQENETEGADADQ